MKAGDMFVKPVDRPIEGVIKADDLAGLAAEVDEYILTGEMEIKLEQFLEAYNDYNGANGVWISGFFGSGKSHLLKILALLLENRKINGTPILDLFLPKCGDNELLKGALVKAASTPAKSILFNIDQKATIISKEQIDALLTVFVKVFDEMCGYYGQVGHVAQFERDLQKQGIYEKFQQEFEQIARIPWQKGRERYPLQKRNIDKAYCVASGQPEDAEKGILDEYAKVYKVSIENFANNVREWVNSQEPNFHLNFFVDEVGQYIAANSKLMTNLQTIAESLATKCNGRAWLIVTAQEAMNKVIGDMDAKQGHDFSKIQDRFKTRLPLTSQDVDEVIQKRLLEKKPQAVAYLTDLYKKAEPSLKTLFDFGEGCRHYENYRDQEHFIRSWPFVPYQFQLFQEAIRGLSRHNAFEGRHSSVGERSMLGVFQDVAIRLSRLGADNLATFDLMFEGLRGALKSQIQKDILQAENSSLDQFSISVLKALFLVKYVKEFKATSRNIGVLLLHNFDQDMTILNQNVAKALTELENQTYIQRSDNVYEYLTDEEKDVEEEIKSTEVEPAEILDELSYIVFDCLLNLAKIRLANGRDYPFAKKVDDHLKSRDQELAINLITPFHDNSASISTLQMQNMGRSELLIALPDDPRLMADLRLYLQTKKYARQNSTINVLDERKRIIDAKSAQNTQRQKALCRQLRNLLGAAEMFACGSPAATSGEDAANRVQTGFGELVARVYTHLGMLRGLNYSEKDLSGYLQPLPGLTDNNPEEAEQEILAFINSLRSRGERATLKILEEHFQRKPYGWPHAAILCLLAKLAAKGKVEILYNASPVPQQELESKLKNTSLYGSLLLAPQTQFTPSQIKRLQKTYEELFSDDAARDFRQLVAETRRNLQSWNKELTDLLGQQAQFPFLSQLEPVQRQTSACLEQNLQWFIEEFPEKTADFSAMRDELLDPVRNFMAGKQRQIYSDARQFLQSHEKDFSYAGREEARDLAALLARPDCFRGNAMQLCLTALDKLQKQLAGEFGQKLAAALQSLEQLKRKLQQMPEFAKLTEEHKGEILREFERQAESMKNAGLIALLENDWRKFEEEGYSSLIARVCDLAAPKADPGLIEKPAPFEQRVISIAKIRPAWDAAYLANEKDVDDWLAVMRKNLLAEIKQGKKVQI